jgi:hypothetical protein
MCRSTRSVEAYNNYNKPLKLTHAIDTDNDDGFRYISYMKCRKCGREFYPMWIGKFPAPMIKSNLTEFMNFFEQSKITAETTKR